MQNVHKQEGESPWEKLNPSFPMLGWKLWLMEQGIFPAPRAAEALL